MPFTFPNLQGPSPAAAISFTAHQVQYGLSLLQGLESRGRNYEAAAQLKSLALRAEAGQHIDARPDIEMPSASPRRAEVAPRLIPLDDGFDEILFQFSPEQFNLGRGEKWAQGVTYQQAQPILAHTGSELDTFSWEAVFTWNPAWVNDENARWRNPQDLWAFVWSILEATRRSPRLGRPPLWTLSWGDITFADVAITTPQTTLKNMQRQWDEASGGTNDFRSYPDEYRINITALRYYQTDHQRTDPDAVQRDTIYTVAHARETWEHIAARIYGDAAYGEFLRRLHPKSRTPEAGIQYRLPDKEKLDALPAIQADSIALRRTDANLRMFNKLAEHHARQRYGTGYSRAA